MSTPEFMARYVADSRNRPEWLSARVGRIGASDAANFAKVASWPLYLRAKLAHPFTGNTATQHGHAREPHILRQFGLAQNHAMFHAVGNPRHVCTPDGILVKADGTVKLAQVKTANRPLPERIPPGYLRQMWWEQYVMGATETLLCWEHHENYKPVSMEAEGVIIQRDDDRIADLIEIADLILAGLDRATADRKMMENPHG